MAEELAKFIHKEYEKIAVAKGWKTQENCQVPFEKLPEANKQTMIAVSHRILEKLDRVSICEYCHYWNDRKYWCSKIKMHLAIKNKRTCVFFKQKKGVG